MQGPENLLPKDGCAQHFRAFFSKNQSDRFLTALANEIAWKQEPIFIFGKSVMQPRLTAWYGDAGKNYSYSGITMVASEWTPELFEIKDRIEKASGFVFNSALLNQYRDGSDSVGWHRDNEKELGKNPIIASVSFGATRAFHFRHRNEKSLLASVDLEHGSLLLMHGKTQHCWYHSIPKTRRIVNSRINITYRFVKPL